MKIFFRLKNELGDFKSEIMEVTEEQYENLIQISKTFYTGSFELYLENGFMVVPPEILKKSLLIIEVSEWN